MQLCCHHVPDEWKGAVMDSLINVKLAIELKVCLLETILEKARKFVPFFPELCIKLATLTYFPLKVRRTT
jgi:hypothetical protein